jgi:hypothetical protein
MMRPKAVEYSELMPRNPSLVVIIEMPTTASAWIVIRPRGAE